MDSLGRWKNLHPQFHESKASWRQLNQYTIVWNTCFVSISVNYLGPENQLCLLVLPRASATLSISDQLQYIWGIEKSLSGRCPRHRLVAEIVVVPIISLAFCFDIKDMKFRSFSQFISPRPTLWAGTCRYMKTNFFLVTQIIPNYCNGVYFSHTWKTRSTVPQRKKYLSWDFCLQKTSAFYDSVIEQSKIWQQNSSFYNIQY